MAKNKKILKIKGTVTFCFMYLSQDIKPIVQDIKSYENLQNSWNLLKLIVQSENDIENNEIIEQEKIFVNLEQKLFG